MGKQIPKTAGLAILAVVTPLILGPKPHQRRARPRGAHLALRGLPRQEPRTRPPAAQGAALLPLRDE